MSYPGRLVVLAAAALVGCSGRPQTSPLETEERVVASELSELFVLPPIPAVDLFGPDVRSLRLRKSVAVRAQPRRGSVLLGTVAAHTRVGWRSVAVGAGCSKRWVEITPHGWVCEQFLDPSTERPSGVELPRLYSGELVPGKYGKVTEGDLPVHYYRRRGGEFVPAAPVVGSVRVRQREEVVDPEGQRFWSIGRGRYLRDADVRAHEPSRWRGVQLGDASSYHLPIAFALPRRRGTRRTPVFRRPEVPRWQRSRRLLAHREVVSILETHTDQFGRAVSYRIGVDRWVRAEDVRVARRAAPPPRTDPGERWIDIDNDEQVLVAYEGEYPVFATLVSGGARGTDTPTGVFRIKLKFAETDMDGQLEEQEPYEVAAVPWTQFYDGDFGLHASYWHDRFGRTASHGCINLSPHDARFLYFWTPPMVPPGWSMVRGSSGFPGALVRVRNGADPEPEFVGYALDVFDDRAGVAL